MHKKTYLYSYFFLQFPFLGIVFIVFVPHSYVLAMALYHPFFLTELHYIYALKTSWIVLANARREYTQQKPSGFSTLYKKNCLGLLLLFLIHFFIPSSSSSFFLCVVSSSSSSYCCFFLLFLAFNSF